MAFEEVLAIVPNFGGVRNEVDVALDEARATARRILAAVGATRAPFVTPPTATG
jgi:hypothetical protein